MATVAAPPVPGITKGRPHPRVLWALAAAGLGLGVALVLMAYSSDHLLEPGIRSALLVWITVPYVAAGLLAWWRRPDSRFGPLMVAAGFVMAVSGLQWSNAAVPYTLGYMFDLLPIVLYLHVFLAFPSGRLRNTAERITVGAGYVVAVALQLVKALLGAGGPDDLLTVSTQLETAAVVEDIELFTLAGLSLLGILLLALRRRSEGRPRRRSIAFLVDVFVLVLVMNAVLMVAGAVEYSEFETVRRVTFVGIGLAPIAFLIGLLDERLARSGVADLLLELRSEPAPARLRDAFARALRDSSLTVAYWLPQFGAWADGDGRPVELPGPGERRSVTVIDRDGQQVAALVHDPSLDDEPELLEAVSAAAEMALENARLESELKARLDELRGSRSRVLEAGQRERKRLERDLHDGAQQRLVALSLDLSLLEQRMAGDPEAQAGLDQARREIARSLEELRDVARGLHPAVLSGHGLEVALESLAARAPVPVQLSVSLGAARVPERLEVAVFYVVSESLTNIGKHARAGSATVDVASADGELVVEVVDDGVGGADTETGTGLRGLADRVEALDGRLRVWTPVGGGTRVRAEIPCE